MSRAAQARGGPTLRLSYSYAIYGLTLQSEIPLALAPSTGSGGAEVVLTTAPGSFFTEALRGAEVERLDGFWYQRARTVDGSIYLRWEGVGEFLISPDGRRLACCEASAARPESFHVYLLGQALSFALVKHGLEPLHATVVAIDGKVAALLGSSGMGKSTLAACLLRAGGQLVTDDLLVLRREERRFFAEPGPARIKLFPDVARILFGEITRGVAVNPDTEKLVLPLEHPRICTGSQCVDAFYSLAEAEPADEDQVVIERLTTKAAIIELLKHTYNRYFADGPRLQQQLEAAASVAAALPVKRLAYKRDLRAGALVVDAIRSDLLEAVRPPSCSAPVDVLRSANT